MPQELDPAARCRDFRHTIRRSQGRCGAQYAAHHRSELIEIWWHSITRGPSLNRLRQGNRPSSPGSVQIVSQMSPQLVRALLAHEGPFVMELIPPGRSHKAGWATRCNTSMSAAALTRDRPGVLKRAGCRCGLRREPPAASAVHTLENPGGIGWSRTIGQWPTCAVGPMPSTGVPSCRPSTCSPLARSTVSPPVSGVPGRTG